MGTIVQFHPNNKNTPQENLLSFVHVCKSELTAFGSDLVFDDDTWDITDALRIKGKREGSKLMFSVWGPNGRRTRPPMPEPFKSFAKAYIRYQHGLRPSKGVDTRLAALRALCDALTEGNGTADPVRLTPFHFNRAAQLLTERIPASAYRVGTQMEMIAELMASCRLLRVPLSWSNPIPRQCDAPKVGKEFQDRRNAKLPSPEALSALAAIFRMASKPAEIAVTSIAAILCAAPERINEVLRLAIDSECSDKVPSTGQSVYGLRWYPSKEATPQIKWVVKSMEGVVQQAFKNLINFSAPARRIAEWYECNPESLYLPEDLEYFREQDSLSMKELGEVLFVEPVSYKVADLWCKTYHVPKLKQIGQRNVVRFADVERAVLSMLPRGFPVADADHGLRYSKVLCLSRKNELHRNRATYRCMFMPLGQADVGSRLGRGSIEHLSIFSDHGFTELDGSPIRISSHQFRHYLNTVAQMGGLSQMDIAKWSGRVRVDQNAAYDHQSGRDILESVRQAVGSVAPSAGPLAKQSGAQLIQRRDFARLKVPTAHTTEFGYCIHDFTMLPCQLHQDCINCQEHVCIKGERFKEQRVRALKEETRVLLAQAEDASQRLLAGAQRWVDHQKRTLAHAEALCSIYDDPTVPDGAVINLNVDQAPSRLAQAVADRQSLLAITGGSRSAFKGKP
jgi:hypothetical protein